MQQDSNIPPGLCQCGCGRPTNIAPWTNPKTGLVKGQPYRYALGHSSRVRPIGSEKPCSKCGETKSLDSFNKAAKERDGHKSVCKACQHIDDLTYRVSHLDQERERGRTKMRAAYAANPEKMRERGRAYYWSHREEQIEKSVIYNKNHQTQIRARQRTYWASRPGKKAENLRRRYAALSAEQKEKLFRQNEKWRSEHPETVTAMRRAGLARRRAREHQSSGRYSAADVRRQMDAQKGKCYWCNNPVGDSYHVDHVTPISRGGSNGPENIVIACPKCNQSKKAKMPWEIPNGRLL